MKVLIDVDTGVDDAQALMMALSTPEVEVVGVTCVAGNVGVDQVCINTLRVLRVMDALDSVPVYRGAPWSLLGNHLDSKDHHGSNGLGDSLDSNPPSVDLIQTQHAANAIVELVNKFKGEVTLVALGPLTNIALALQLDVDLGKKLKKVVVMGGNMEGVGNITVSSEFNFSQDPEAAWFVLERLGCQIQLLCWEACLRNNLEMIWMEELRKVDTARGRFHRDITDYTIKRVKEVYKLPKYHSCDPTAMAIALDESIVLERKHAYCTVELHGEITRGQMVVDWNSNLQKPINVDIITVVNVDKLKECYKQMVE